MDKLKACPFCGHMPVCTPIYGPRKNGDFGTERKGYILKCSKCRAEMRGDRISDIMKSWNRRVDNADL